MTTMKSVAEALEHMHSAVGSLTGGETIAIEDSLDRVLAEPVSSTMDVPAYDNSAMDGYAFKAEDVSSGTSLKLVGTALAGHPYTGDCPPGCCIRIMTGAQVPAVTDTVIAQEDTEANGDMITIHAELKVGSNIRRQGEEIRQGEAIYTAGHCITPVDIGLLASLGRADINVRQRLRVALFSTGDELVQPGQTLSTGQLYDSNRYVLKAMLQRLGCEVIDLGLIADDKDAIREAFESSSQQADAIICSGGVSVGDADYTKQILDSYGSVGFWKVAMKPGKPFAFGKVNDAWFFGLPGNPVSAVVTFDQLALPIIQKMRGIQDYDRIALRLQAGTAFKKRPGRADFQRALIQPYGDQSRVFSTGPQGSAMLTSLAEGNCYVQLDAEQGSVQEGEWVTVIPFTSPLR
ncbi:MAG: molybdopterin molybdotransferase MoeA [Idiomarina sp.]|nr:molybdopterin molybdotransferase MoeA [Idiomarina sp.]